MKSVIEDFTSATGWTGSSAKAGVQGINELPEFIAGLNSKSLIFKFNNNPVNEYVEKTISFDLTGFDEIVLWTWSRNKRTNDYKVNGDFSYKIEFGTGDVFFVPMFNTFSDSTFSIKGLGAITKIRITCLHGDDDYLIFSNMVAVKDEIPVDIWRAVKEQLDYDIQSIYPRVIDGVQGKGIHLGKVSAATGDKSITVSDSLKLADKYSLVLIDDGTNSERHHLDSNDGLEFRMFSEYDGDTILHDYTDADLYLLIPAEFGMSESEINLPGMNIQGMTPEEDLNINKLDHVRDTASGGDVVSERRADANFRYVILIDCEARTNEMIAIMSQVVKYFIARQVLWVNGKRIEIIPELGSQYIDPIEAFNQIPKAQFSLAITIKEEVYNREILYKTIQNNRIFNIRRL